MDNRKGQFEFLGDANFKALEPMEQANTFKVGEVLEIKDSRFRIQKITQKGMQLKLVKPAT